MYIEALVIYRIVSHALTAIDRPLSNKGVGMSLEQCYELHMLSCGSCFVYANLSYFREP